MLASIRDVQVIAQPMERDMMRAGYVWRGRLLNFDVSVGRLKEKFDVVDQSPALTDGEDRRVNELKLVRRLHGGRGY